MAGASTVPVVKAALVAGWQTLDVLAAPVQVSYGWLGPATKAQDGSICLDPPGEALRGTMSLPLMKAGRLPQREEYQVLCLIQYADKGIGADGAEAVESRCFELFAAVHGWLAEKPTANLSNAALQGWAAVGDYTRWLVPEDRGWLSQILVTLDVHATLRG